MTPRYLSPAPVPAGLRRLACLVCAFGLFSVAPTPILAMVPHSVVQPSGEYAMVTLDFQFPAASPAFNNWRILTGMRDGVIVVDHGAGVSQPGGTLTAEGNALTGTFYRVNSASTSEGRITVDATFDPDGGVIQGHALLQVDGLEIHGTLTGTVTGEAELRAANAIDRSVAWSQFTGPHAGGLSAEPKGLSLIGHPSEIRFQWFSEATDIGQNLGSITRFMFQFSNSRLRTSSGSSSPVLQNGRIYLSYFVPTATFPNPRQKSFTAGHAAFETAAQNMVNGTALFDDPADLPFWALEKIWEGVDDVVICIDAETGQTLWKTVMPLQGYNRQHHKEGPFNMTLAVEGDRVFAMSTGGNLYGLDSATGELLWARNIAPGEFQLQAHSVLALPEIVVVPEGGYWSAINPETGVRIRQYRDFPGLGLPTSRYRTGIVSSPQVWYHGGTPYLLFGEAGGYANTGLQALGNNRGGSDLFCVNALTGELLWRFPMNSANPARDINFATSGRGSHPGGYTLSGDYLVAYEASGPAGSTRNNIDDYALVGYALSPAGATEIWRQSMVAHAGDSNPLVINGRWVVDIRMRVFDIETGVQTSQATGFLPNNGGYVLGMEDLVIMQFDGTHGAQAFAFYKINDDGIIQGLNSGSLWSPPVGGGQTTGYKTPIHYPLVDGRLFLRMASGIAAYDLRDPNSLFPPFDQWIAGFADIPAEQRGPHDDFSGDGWPNLLSMALGLDPRDHHAALQPVRTVRVDGQRLVTVDLSGQHTALHYALEASGDFITWHTLAEAANGSALVPNPDSPYTLTSLPPADGVYTFSLNSPAPGELTAFRLRVSLP